LHKKHKKSRRSRSNRNNLWNRKRRKKSKSWVLKRWWRLSNRDSLSNNKNQHKNRKSKKSYKNTLTKLINFWINSVLAWTKSILIRHSRLRNQLRMRASKIFPLRCMRQISTRNLSLSHRLLTTTSLSSSSIISTLPSRTWIATQSTLTSTMHLLKLLMKWPWIWKKDTRTNGSTQKTIEAWK